MKKFFYSILAVAGLLTAASCAREVINSANPADGGPVVTATFSVGLDDAIVTKADFGTGASVTELLYGVYDKDGALISSDSQAVTDPAANQEVTITLVKNQEYTVVFWAQASGAYTPDFTNKVIPIATPENGVVTLDANSDAYDAFYANVAVNTAEAVQYSVELTRPFAQVNVLTLTENIPANTTFESEMTVQGVPYAIDLLTGAPGENTATFKFSKKAITPAEGDAVIKEGYTLVGSNFVLVPGDNNAEMTVSFKVNDLSERTVTPLHLQRNYRTNLYGDLFGDNNVDVSFLITINPGAGEGGNVSYDNANTSIEVVDLQPDEDGRYPISNGDQISINLKASDGTTLIADDFVEEPTVTFSSDNTDAFTVGETDGIVATHTYGTGHINITVSDFSATKVVEYNGLTHPMPVYVADIDAPVEEEKAVTVTISGAPESLDVADEPVTLTAEVTVDGEELVLENPTITWATSNENVATVVDGVVTAVAEGSVTITASYAGEEGVYQAGTAEVTIAITDEEGGGGETGDAKTLPYEETFLGSIGDFTTDEVEYAEGKKVWVNDSKYGMKASAYDGSAAQASESWLTSPLIAIPSNATAPTLSFDHAVNKFAAIGNVATEATVWIKEEGGSWTALSVTFPTSLSWTYVSSGDVDLSSYKGKNIQIGFKYVSTTSSAGTWEIKNFKVEDASQPIPFDGAFAAETKTVKVGATVTNTFTCSNTEGTKSYSSSNANIASVDASTGVVTGVAEGGPVTITVTVGEAGRYEGGSATYTVTVEANNPNEKSATLTNDEIVAALSGSSATSNSYGAFSITSDSGTWTGNMNTKNDLTYVQIRNNKGANLTSPTFTDNIDRIELTVNGGTGSNVQSRNFYAIAPNTDLSAFGDANYNANDNSEKWAAVTKYGNGSSTAQSTNVETTVEIPFDVDAKSFMLVTYNGAAYITSIKVYFK